MDLRPKLVASSQRLQEPINQCDVIADMDSVRRKVSDTAQFNPIKQILA